MPRDSIRHCPRILTRAMREEGRWCGHRPHDRDQALGQKSRAGNATKASRRLLARQRAAQREPGTPDGVGEVSAFRFPYGMPDRRVASAGSPEVDQLRAPPKVRFVPRILREQGTVTLPVTPSREDQLQASFVPSILQRGGAVTPPITPPQAPPVAAPVTPAVTVVPVAGSICPTCQCRVPARLTPAERQRAYRKRPREQRQGLAGD
jgi:hypothetical protein